MKQLEDSDRYILPFGFEPTEDIVEDEAMQYSTPEEYEALLDKMTWHFMTRNGPMGSLEGELENAKRVSLYDVFFKQLTDSCLQINTSHTLVLPAFSTQTTPTIVPSKQSLEASVCNFK